MRIGLLISGHAHWCVRKSLGLREGGLEVAKNLFRVKFLGKEVYFEYLVELFF